MPFVDFFFLSSKKYLFFLLDGDELKQKLNTLGLYLNKTKTLKFLCHLFEDDDPLRL